MSDDGLRPAAPHAGADLDKWRREWARVRELLKRASPAAELRRRARKMTGARDRHLFAPGPKRILALDGGGTRGIIAIAFLERLEHLLQTRHPHLPGLRLCDYFDLIGGTSTGAIIAAGLAVGMRVAEVKQVYLDLAPKVFRTGAWRPWALQPRFNAAPLMVLLREHFGLRTLDSPSIHTGLAIMMKRLDTGSPWMVSNNPRAPYWDDPAEGSVMGNRHYDLATLVRASTAAPFFFRPERISMGAGLPRGLFIDGGASPYNNPCLMLLMLATMRRYGLAWRTGADQLMVVSIGTGQFRRRVDPDSLLARTALGLSGQALSSLASDGQHLTLTLMQWLSEPCSPWPLNSEIGDLDGEVLGDVPLWAFQRYDVALEETALRNAGETVTTAELRRLRDLASVSSMPRNYKIAVREAEHQVQTQHFAGTFDLPTSRMERPP